MNTHKMDDGYLVVLEKGDLLIQSLKTFCQTQSLKAGWFSGIGAVTQIELGFYQLEPKKYRFKNFNNLMEIVSLTGNVTELNHELMAHAHIVLSDANYRVFGGHVKEATIAGTAELYFKLFDYPLRRGHDEATGLNLIKL